MDPNTGAHLDMSGGYAPFRVGEPNGDEAENCVIKWTDESWLNGRFWVDYSCDDESIASCFLEQSPTHFQLRGMYGSMTSSLICIWLLKHSISYLRVA